MTLYCLIYFTFHSFGFHIEGACSITKAQRLGPTRFTPQQNRRSITTREGGDCCERSVIVLPAGAKKMHQLVSALGTAFQGKGRERMNCRNRCRGWAGARKLMSSCSSTQMMMLISCILSKKHKSSHRCSRLLLSNPKERSSKQRNRLFKFPKRTISCLISLMIRTLKKNPPKKM